MNNSFSLLEDIKVGWRYPYRSKKAHCFRHNTSICGKHTLSDYEMGGLLPRGAFYKEQLCSKCLNDKWAKEYYKPKG